MLENQIGEMSDDIKNSYAEFFGDMVDSEWGNDKMDEKYELFGLFSKEGKVKRICRTYGIRNYTINSDGSIDIDGNVDLTYKISEKLLLKFGNVSGSFYCHKNKLMSLEGCPKSVGGSFYCDNNHLTSLEGCPRSVGIHFSCNNNQLTSLEGCPKSVGGEFYCYGNRLTSLEGCPKSVGGDFYCYDNELTSLVGSPKSIRGVFNCNHNELTTFEGLDFVSIGGGVFYCFYNPIYEIWRLFEDHTKFEFFNDCDIIRENRVIILDRLNFFLDYIAKETVTEVEGYKCI